MTYESECEIGANKMGEKVKVFMNHLLSQPVVLQKTRQNCTSQYFVLSIDSSDMYRVLSRVRFYDLFKSSGNFHFAYYMPNTFLFQWNESRCWDSIRIIFSERKKKTIIHLLKSITSFGSHDWQNKCKQSARVIIKLFVFFSICLKQKKRQR